MRDFHWRHLPTPTADVVRGHRAAPRGMAARLPALLLLSIALPAITRADPSPDPASLDRGATSEEARALPEHVDEATTGERPSSETTENPRLRIHLRQFRLDLNPGRDVTASCDLSELLHYTPVNGLQPGVACLWRRSQPGRSTEIVLDSAVNLGGQSADWLLGPRLRVPAWHLAEVGVQAYDLTDTSDQWRADRRQSSLSFATQNRPEADFFRRRGWSAFVTAQVAQRGLLGIEYRLDDYRSLATRDDVWILPQDMEIAVRNPAVQAGRMGSLIMRAEWSSAPIPIESVGVIRRQPEMSLVTEWPRSEHMSFRTLNTLEIARPALGGDSGFSFTRLISEHSLRFDGGALRGLKLRARFAGAWDAPPQKEEGLGGWGSVRGYSFKRYRGDLSLMGTIEYRYRRLAAFGDAGSVREPAGWSGLLTGVGMRLFFWRDWNLGVAWRTSGAGAGAFPSVRLQLTQGW